MPSVSCPDAAVKSDGRKELAEALLTVERRIVASTYWLASLIIAGLGIASAIVIAALK